ncbi:hypothetical protein [Rhodococcoides fascians]|uniref:hypothetical protein n=1 Tax=Rhodococcoides fascians TaxID=1828 RepID=UPI000A7C7CAB|nr:hypothetical protein [Rhodococcus fascians]
MTKRDEIGDEAEVVIDGSEGHIDVFLASAYEETFRVRYSRTEFARLLWQGWVVLIRSL